MNEREGERDTAFTSGGNCFAATSPSVVNTALVCEAVSGYNCLDTDIVSTDRGSEEWERKKVCGGWL